MRPPGTQRVAPRRRPGGTQHVLPGMQPAVPGCTSQAAPHKDRRTRQARSRRPRQQGTRNMAGAHPGTRQSQARNIPIWSGCVGMLFLEVIIHHHVWAVGMLGILRLQACNLKVASLQPCNLAT